MNGALYRTFCASLNYFFNLYLTQYKLYALTVAKALQWWALLLAYVLHMQVIRPNFFFSK